MFDSLEEQMKHDDQEAISPKERMLKWLFGAITAVVVFGGLYMGIRLIE
jgi:hypothetical protein